LRPAEASHVAKRHWADQRWRFLFVIWLRSSGRGGNIAIADFGLSGFAMFFTQSI
jgi:hypothetical protein